MYLFIIINIVITKRDKVNKNKYGVEDGAGDASERYPTILNACAT